MNLEHVTAVELEIEQIKRALAKTDAEIRRLLEVMPRLLEKQSRRRQEIERQQLRGNRKS